MSKNTYSTIIIGGGLSGLAALKRLIQKGHQNVILLESNEKVGGRVHTYTKNNLKLDKGASWIGPTQTRMIQLLKEYNIQTIEQYTEGTIPPISVRDLLKFAYTQFKLDFYAQRVNLQNPYKSPSYLKSFDDITLQQYAKQHLGENTPGFLSFQAAVDTILGINMADISVLYFLFYIKCAGDVDSLINTRGGAQQDRIQGGSEALPIKIFEQYKQYIRLSKVVTKVDNKVQGKILVYTNDKNEIFECKNVIVCIPPQGLKGKVEFTNIEEKKRQQIESMKIGQLLKCFLVFKTAFWRKQGYSGMILNTRKQPCLYYDLSNDQYGILLGFYQQGREQEQQQFLKKSEKEREKIVFQECVEFLGEEQCKEQFLFYSDDNFIGHQQIQGCPAGVAGLGYWREFGDVWKYHHNGVYWASTECSTVWNGYMEGAVIAGEEAAEEVLKQY